MEPKTLAVNHSKIIDAKLNQLRDAFIVIKNEVAEGSARLVNQMIVDDKGVCTNCKENRALVTKSLSLVRTALKKQRPIINGIYGDGVAQIDMLANDYITWMKSNG